MTHYDEGMQGLAVTYWNNTQLAGQSAAHALGVGDPGGTVNANWGTGSPAVGVNADSFSARLTGDIVLPQAGGWILQVVSDDGVRVWVDDQEVLDSWIDQGPTAHGSSAIWVADPAKHHRIRLDYYGFGRPVRDVRLMPRRDLVTPAQQGAPEGVDLDRARLVLEVVAETLDELDRELGVVVFVDAAHYFFGGSPRLSGERGSAAEQARSALPRHPGGAGP